MAATKYREAKKLAEEAVKNGTAVNRLPSTENVQITPPKLTTIRITVVGTTPYVQNKFSAKAKAMMKKKQEAGGQAKKGGAREAKNFQECYQEAMYKPTEGNWHAIPATAFKAAMVAACRLVDFKMTDAKQCVYIEADGYDKDEMIPLVKITKGKPEYFEQAVRNDSGVADIRARPRWAPGWEAEVRITYDSDRFTSTDVSNLLMRAGCQVGIGEGRMASRMCVGLGWGSFEIKNPE